NARVDREALAQRAAQGSLEKVAVSKATTTSGTAPVSDAMSGTTLAEAPKMVPSESGLQAGQSGNPFEGMGGMTSGLRAQSLRFAERALGFGDEVMLSDQELGKLSVLGSHSVSDRFSGHRKLSQGLTKLQEGTMLLMADAVDGDGEGDRSLAQLRSQVAGVVHDDVLSPNLERAMGNAMFAQKSAFPAGMDVNAFVQAVLREAYMLDGEMLMDQARKLDALNRWKESALKKKRRAEELRLKIKHAAPEPDPEDLEELAALLGFELDDSPAPLEPENLKDEPPESAAPEDADGDGAPAESAAPTPAEATVSSGEPELRRPPEEIQAEIEASKNQRPVVTGADSAWTHAKLTADSLSGQSGSEGDGPSPQELLEDLEIDFNDGEEPYVLKFNQMSAEEMDEVFANRLGKLDDAIETRGFDMSELQLDIQNLQQKRQQMLTMMSNLSKMMHDLAMSIIRNIGG
ncbi:MAG: hypothetical protein AAFQ82_21640, partial [Myxococcota bacterium]